MLARSSQRALCLLASSGWHCGKTALVNIMKYLIVLHYSVLNFFEVDGVVLDHHVNNVLVQLKIVLFIHLDIKILDK